MVLVFANTVENNSVVIRLEHRELLAVLNRLHLEENVPRFDID